MSNRLYNNKTTLEYKYGFWYEHPRSLTMEGWTEWETNVKKNHPVQYFVREFANDTRYTLRGWYRKVKNGVRWVFNPCHQDLRKAIPRSWSDISDLIVDVNFAMILSFKKEADESHVDWDGTEKHREFKNWLDSAAHWITVGRPNCQAQADALYPEYPLSDLQKGKSYEELYGELNKIEKLIEETNSNIIKQMVDNREYFWT